jgi:DNA invertase Pin-like site-specific DNA recombinase
MKVVIYTRVSTDTQDTERQIKELEELSKRMNWDVQKVFKETISGAKKNTERKGLMDMVGFIQENKVDRVVVWELSRLGRSTLEVLKTLEEFHSNGIGLYIHNYSLHTLTEKGEVNPMARMMVTMLSEFATMERETIRQRMVSGFKNYIEKGGRVGREKGWSKGDDKLLEEHKDVAKLLRQGLSVRKVMKLTDKSSGTVQKIKKLL